MFFSALPHEESVDPPRDQPLTLYTYIPSTQAHTPAAAAVHGCPASDDADRSLTPTLHGSSSKAARSVELFGVCMHGMITIGRPTPISIHISPPTNETQMETTPTTTPPPCSWAARVGAAWRAHALGLELQAIEAAGQERLRHVPVSSAPGAVASREGIRQRTDKAVRACVRVLCCVLSVDRSIDRSPHHKTPVPTPNYIPPPQPQHQQ